MNKPNLLESLFSNILEQTLEALHDPFCSRDKIDNMIGFIIAKINFFHKILDIPIRLEEFIHLAKSYFIYERHTYGSVLIKDKEPAQKFYILLKGTAEKISQRPYNEIEKELWKKSRMTVIIKNVAPIQSSHLRSLAVPNLSKKISGREPSCFITDNGTLQEVDKNEPGYNENAYMFSTQRRGCLKLDEVTSSTQLDFDNFPSQIDEGIDPLFGFSSELFKLKDGVKSKVMTCHTRPEIKTEPDLDQLVSDNIEKEDEGDTEEIEAKSPLLLNRKRTFERRKRSKAFTRFLEDVVSKNTSLKERCFVGSINRVKKTKTYTPGQYFRENFHKIPEAIENTIIAVSSEEAHFLTINKESFKRVMTELYKKANEKTRFFQDTFPSLTEEMIKRLSHYFSQKHFKKGEVIYSQKDSPKEFYLLNQGDVTLFKEIEEASKKFPHILPLGSPKSSRKRELPVASIIKNQFFGEELILGESERQYSAISKSPDTVVYFLDAYTYDRIKRRFSSLFKTLRAQATERFEWRRNRVEDLMEQQKPLPTHTLGAFSLSIPNFVAPSYTKPKAFYSGEAGYASPKSKPEQINHTLQAPEHLTCPRIKSLSNSSYEEDMLRTKNLTLYKTKFSRKAQVLPDVEIEARTFPKKPAEPPKIKINNGHVVRPPTSIFEVNVRKELEDSKTVKIRIPKFPSVSEFRIKNGSVTTRASESHTKDTHNFMVPSMTDRSHDSTGLKSFNSPCGSHGFETPRSEREEAGFGKFTKILREVCSGVGSGSKKRRIKKPL